MREPINDADSRPTDRERRAEAIDCGQGDSGRGRQILERLRGRGDVAMTTDDVMALTRDR